MKKKIGFALNGISVILKVKGSLPYSCECWSQDAESGSFGSVAIGNDFPVHGCTKVP